MALDVWLPSKTAKYGWSKPNDSAQESLGIGLKIKYPDKTVAGWMGSRVGGMLNLIKVQKWSFDACPTSPPAAPLLLKERLNDSLLPLLCKERLGEVLMAKHNS
ncbi:MAG: hypothetical protein AAF827_08480, partial [Cyanobacteria bacterium P01_D01_bin.6]